MTTQSEEPSGWNGEFALICQSNARHALEEFSELDAYRWTAAYREMPSWPRMAVDIAWYKARESLKLHRECIATWFAPWFDESAFQ